MSLADLVSVTITTEATAITEAGFGVPLIAGYHTVFPERVRFYTSLSGMTSDGFVTTDPFYKAAAALQAQNPAVPRWAIGRCALAPTQVMHLTPAAVHEAEYGVTILSDTEVAERFEYTADAATTVQEIVEGLVAAIGSSVTDVTATEDDTKVILTGSAGKWFGVEVDDDTGNANGMGQWTVKDASTDPGIATDLAAILTENNEWYGLILTHQSEAAVLAAAAWVESNKKLLIASTQDSDAKSSATTDLLSDLETAAYARTAAMYHQKSHQFPAAALMGKVFPFEPGGWTGHMKTLAGIDASILTATEITNLNNKTANFYVTRGGVNVLYHARSASGEFIDTTQFVDWLTARLQERLFGLMVNAKKIPFTDAGVAAIQAAVSAQLQEGIDAGGLSDNPAPTVTVPLVADVSTNDKALRRLPDVNFSATLAGAIHSMVITGTVTV